MISTYELVVSICAYGHPTIMYELVYVLPVNNTHMPNHTPTRKRMSMPSRRVYDSCRYDLVFASGILLSRQYRDSGACQHRLPFRGVYGVPLYLFVAYAVHHFTFCLLGARAPTLPRLSHDRATPSACKCGAFGHCIHLWVAYLGVRIPTVSCLFLYGAHGALALL